jgi:hypothetical protein
LKKFKIKASLDPKYSKSKDNHVQVFEKEKEIQRTTNFEYFKNFKVFDI